MHTVCRVCVFGSASVCVSEKPMIFNTHALLCGVMGCVKKYGQGGEGGEGVRACSQHRSVIVAWRD